VSRPDYFVTMFQSFNQTINKQSYFQMSVPSIDDAQYYNWNTNDDVLPSLALPPAQSTKEPQKKRIKVCAIHKPTPKESTSTSTCCMPPPSVVPTSSEPYNDGYHKLDIIPTRESQGIRIKLEDVLKEQEQKYQPSIYHRRHYN